MLAWLHFVNAISKSLMDTTDEFYLKRVFLFKQWKTATKNKASYRSVRGKGYSQRMLNTQAPESDNTELESLALPITNFLLITLGIR